MPGQSVCRVARLGLGCDGLDWAEVAAIPQGMANSPRAMQSWDCMLPHKAGCRKAKRVEEGRVDR